MRYSGVGEFSVVKTNQQNGEFALISDAKTCCASLGGSQKITSMARLSCLALTLVLSACAVGLQPYAMPTTGPKAYLSVVDSTGDVLPVGEVMVASFDEPETCQGRSFLHGMAKQPPFLTYFKPIRASGPSSFAFYYNHFDGRFVGTLTTCAAIISFSPAPNRYYRAYFSTTGGICDVTLKESATESMSEAVNVPIRRRSVSKPVVNESSSFCGT